MLRLALVAAIFGIIVFGLFDFINGTLQRQGELPSTGRPVVGEGCRVAGCSSQLCVNADQVEFPISNCIYQQEYGCYRTARCEQQPSGLCGWTATPELVSCIQRNRNPSNLGT